MCPRSMTGFGRGEAQENEQSWTVEIRTVNHRFLDQRVILPRQFSALEERVKKVVARYQERGRVEVSCVLNGRVVSGSILTVDMELARQYHDCLRQLGEEFGSGPRVQLADMLNNRDLIRQEEQNPDLDAEWPLLEKAVTEALKACNRMRAQEGESLKTDLTERLDSFAAIVARIEKEVPVVLQQRQQELKTRVKKLLAGMDIDPARLAQETAIMADKADVTEELVRLASHIDQFRSFLATSESVGRRLDFLLQEFLREVNTLASKISNAAIAHLGVEMKNEIEKLREQVQNLE